MNVSGHRRPGQMDALSLAARKFAGPLLQQMFNAEEFWNAFVQLIAMILLGTASCAGISKPDVL